MSIIIFAAEELLFEQRMGIDIRAEYDSAKDVRRNSGPGKVFPGAPSCQFRGKNILDFVVMIPKGLITSQILALAFQCLVDLGIYDQTNPEIHPMRTGVNVITIMTPMVLFDAHNSRLQVPFLRYINNPAYLWKCCIGLPHGTHKWQVGDSEE